MDLIRSILLGSFLIINFPVVANPLDVLSQEEVEPEEIAPSPFSLLGEWWVYLDPEYENFSERVEFVKKGLVESIAGLDSTVKNELSSDIQLVNSYLDNLIKLKTTESEINFPTLNYKERYDFEEFKTLFEKYKSIKAKREQLIKLSEDETSKAKNALDSLSVLLVPYRDIKDNTIEKLRLGLQIMSLRLSWYVWTHRSKVVAQGIEFLNEQEELSLKEIEHAATNMLVVQRDLELINEKIIIQEKRINNIQAEKLKAREAYAKNLGIDYLSRVKLKLYSQKIVVSEIEEASAQIQQLINKSHKALIILNNKSLDDNEINPIDLYESNESALKNTLSQLKKWENVTKQEQEDIQNFIISNIQDNEKAVLTKILDDRSKAIISTIEEQSILESLSSNLNLLNSSLEIKLGKFHGWDFKLRNTSIFLFDQTLLRVWNLLNTSLFELGNVPVTTWDLIQALFILFITYVLARFLQRSLIKLNTNPDGKIPPAIYTLSRVIFYAIIVFGIFSAFASIGINFTNLAIVAGALSVGIGFGLQSVVNNFVSGVIILFEQNIKVGDFVELDSGLKGVVRDINVRSTIVNTLDNLDIIVPNSELVASKVTNFTLNEPIVRIHIPFGVAYGSDKELVKKATLEAVRQVDITYDDGANRRPQVWLTGFGDSSLDFELVTWVSPKLGKAAPGSWRALYNWEIESALQRYDIQIPFPQRDLHIKSHFKDIEPELL